MTSPQTDGVPLVLRGLPSDLPVVARETELELDALRGLEVGIDVEDQGHGGLLHFGKEDSRGRAGHIGPRRTVRPSQAATCSPGSAGSGGKYSGRSIP